MLLFIINLAFAGDYEFLGRWHTLPDVTVCPNSNVDIDDVENAVDYWKTRGHDFGDIYEKSRCDSKYPDGVIQFNDPKNEVDTSRSFGHSQVQEYNHVITSVSIQISEEGSRNYEVVVHELGHALGIYHVDDKTDIMYIYHAYVMTYF